MPVKLAFSGPQAQGKAAEKALEDAGFPVERDQFGEAVRHSHGMADNHLTCRAENGAIVALPTTEPILWLTVEGSDPDRAQAAVDKLGWRLRSQMVVEEAKPLSAEQKLAAIGLTKDELRELLK